MTKNTVTAKIVVVQDKDELNKLILSITAAGKKLDANIQLAGVSALHHLKAHGDIGFINRLYLAMPKGSRKTALASWYLAHGSLIPTTGEGKDQKPFSYTKDKETNVEAAMQDPWFSHKPDQNPDEAFDLQKAVHAIIKKASGKTLEHGDLLPKLQALIIESEEDETPAHADDDAK